MLFPVSSGFSQKTDNIPTLSVVLTSNSPYVYKDSEGYTVVVGAVENTNPLTAVKNVKIQATFYDDVGVAPLEIVEDGTILDVIPPLGKSPYMIKSKSPNPQITQASVFLENFNSATQKSKLLSVVPADISFDGNLAFSGVLKNGQAPISDANVYLAFYDGFQPYRILSVETIPIGNMQSNEQVSFDFNEKINPLSVGFLLFSDSDVFYSEYVNVKIPPPQTITKLVTISDVQVTDLDGNNLSEIPLGTTVNIQSTSWVEFSDQQTSNEIPYTYYVQVKQAGEKPYVEYIGKYDDRFIGEGSQIQSIDWIPDKEGLYYIETFVWDRENIPIADQGPIAIILVS